MTKQNIFPPDMYAVQAPKQGQQRLKNKVQSLQDMLADLLDHVLSRTALSAYSLYLCYLHIWSPHKNGSFAVLDGSYDVLSRSS